MSRRLACRLAGLALGLLATATAAWAAGTPAGTRIPNTATIGYVFNGAPYTQQAAAPPVVVARVLAVRTTWQDSTATPSNSPDTVVGRGRADWERGPRVHGSKGPGVQRSKDPEVPAASAAAPTNCRRVMCMPGWREC